MRNPFEHNKRNLKSGFYFDKKRELICFYYKEEEEEEISFFSSSEKIYNRFSKGEQTGNSLPSFLLPPQGMPNNKSSRLEDLIELTTSVIKDRDSLLKDFQWIYSKASVAQSFIDFLHEQERYEMLEIFKYFVEANSEK